MLADNNSGATTDTGHHQSADLADTSAPLAPSMSLTKNANGYVVGSVAFVVGLAEANSTVKVYSASGEVGTAHADAKGVWSLNTTPFADGMNYQIFAKAIDQAGNVSDASTAVNFNVDAHAPLAPTGSVATISSSNQPVFRGTGEAGTTIQLVNDNTVIGQATVAATGNWVINSNPLPNGNYDVAVVATDKADNAAKAPVTLKFSVASAANLAGTAGNDSLTASAGNNAIDGGAGTDTARYNGAAANFTVAKDVNGYTVTDQVGSNGTDSLIHVERIQFSDANLALDVDGIGGQAYRLYQAAFDRKPDLAGLGYWIKQMDNGLTVNGAAEQFLISPEALKLYTTTNPADANTFFVKQLYANVLHRQIDQAGFDFWMGVLDGHQNTRGEVLAFFSESPENQAQVIGSIENGFAFIPWA